MTPALVKTIDAMLLTSWNIYESYTGPLGAGTLTDIVNDPLLLPALNLPNETAGASGTGQITQGIGMDRTVATGTGYVGQYSPEIAETI